MSVDIKGLQFDPSQSVTIKVWNGTEGVALFSGSADYSIDFQDRGVLVEWFVPNPPDSQVRHLRFVPYSALVEISQSYIVPEGV